MTGVLPMGLKSGKARGRPKAAVTEEKKTFSLKPVPAMRARILEVQSKQDNRSLSYVWQALAQLGLEAYDRGAVLPRRDKWGKK